MDEYNTENDRQMLEINLIGAIAWLNSVAVIFQSANAGQIVGISSVAGERGRVGNPGYNASKAGLTSYLESLRNRLTRHGVNVLTVKAGFVQTDMLKAAQKVMFPITAERAADDIWKAIQGPPAGDLYSLVLALDHVHHPQHSIHPVPENEFLRCQSSIDPFLPLKILGIPCSRLLMWLSPHVPKRSFKRLSLPIRWV
jgi:hypothetical protein